MATIRLTKNIRKAFVRAAMDDVPQIDYASQARTLAQDFLEKQMPPEIKALLADPKLAAWIQCPRSVYLPGQLPTIMAHTPAGYGYYYLKENFPNMWLKLLALQKKADEQDEKLQALRNKLSAAAESVTTLKQLQDLLPEFIKYMPQDEPEAIKTLPAVANIVSDFMTAGWPKGTKK